METLTRDDNHVKMSDPIIIASRSVGSYIKIDSISIDLTDANSGNTSAGKCEHFSIRGYVSDMRKKNPKICWPFGKDGDLDKSDQEKPDILPPMDAPKFRSWCCQNCLREIGSTKIAENRRSTDLNRHVGSDSAKCTGFRMPHNATTALLQSDCQRGPKSKTAHMYTIVDGSETRPSSRIDKRKRNSEDFPSLQLDIAKTNDCRPLILDDCAYASSENQEKSSGSHRKKNRKVRLLTELFDKEDPKNGKSRKEDSPSNQINNTLELESVSCGQVSLQENSRVVSGETKKRKFSEGEEKGYQETSHFKSLSKKVRIPRRDGEVTNAIAGNGLDARISLQAGMKNNLGRTGNEKIHTVGKKKAKKSHNFNAGSSVASSVEKVPVESQQKLKNLSKSATDGASFRLTYDPSAVRGMEFHSSKTDKISGFGKRKGNVPQSDAGKASLLNTRKNVEIKPKGQEAVPFHFVKDSSQKGLDRSLSSYSATQRYDKNCLSQQQDGFPSLSTWKDSTCKLDEFMRKNVEVNYLANLNKPSTSMANPLSEDGVQGEPSKKVYTYNMPVLNVEQEYSDRVEQGSSSLMQQTDISRGSKKQKIIDIEMNPGVPVSRKHSNRKAEISEKGTIDGIPMEIVELMAKNQYERFLHETQNDKHVLETPITERNSQMIEHTQVYGIGDMRVSEEISLKRKAQARHAKNGTTRKYVAPVQQKSDDSFSYINGNHFGMNRLDQMQFATAFGPFSQSQKKPTPRGQFPAAGNSKCSCAKSCKWDGNMMGNGISNSNLQSFASSCNTCHSVPLSNGESAHLWSPLSSLPFAYAAQSSHLKVLSQSTSAPQKENTNGDCDLSLSLNLNVPNFEKSNEAVSSETVSRTNPEYSFNCKRNVAEPHQNSTRSLDLYSNDTIPVMHLLSLMDPGMRSGSSPNMDGNPKHPRSATSNDLTPTEQLGLDFGLCKVTDTVNYPSSNSYVNNCPSEKSLDLFPTNPTFGASSFEQSKGFGSASDFMAQAPIFQKNEKIQRGPTSDKLFAINGDYSNNRSTIPAVHTTPNGFLPVSSPNMFPMFLNSRNHKLGTPNANGTMKPPKTSMEYSICCINRNPADFCTPYVENEYMIRGEDLKVGTKISSGKRNGLYKVDKQKRQMNTKHVTEKLHVRD